MTVVSVVQPVPIGVALAVTQHPRSSGAVDPLFFHAITPDLLTYEIKDVLKGIGDLTEARGAGDSLWLADHENVWREFGDNIPAKYGGRVVKNLFTYSENFDFSTPWYDAGSGTLTINNNAQIAPDGTLTADEVITSASDTQIIAQNYDQPHSNQPVILSVWAKLISGTSTIGGTGGTDRAVTSSWQRFSWAYTTASGLRQHYYTFSTNATIAVWGAQLEDVGGRSDTATPSEYIPTVASAVQRVYGSTNGNSVASNVVTEALGTSLVLGFGERLPGAANKIAWSRDLTNAIWAQTESPSPALDEVGLAEIANTATTLTDNSNSYEFVTEEVPIDNNSDVHVVRVFIKKDADTSRFPSFRLQLTGGTSQYIYLQVNTQTGAKQVTISIGTVVSEVNSVGDWWEILVSVLNNTSGNTNARVTIYPAIGTSISTSNSSAQGSIIVGNAELQSDTTVAGVAGTYPIITENGVEIPQTYGMPYQHGQPAHTNQITYSSDLTNGAWTETGTSVAALDAVGLRGEANGASTLTDNDGSSRESIREDITGISDDSNTHVQRVFIKKDADETRFVGVDFGLLNGTSQRNYLRFNTKTGEIDERQITGTASSEANQYGDWWELLLQLANNTSGNTSTLHVLHPAYANTLTGDDVSATGSIIVGNVELHLNTTIEAVRGSSPIFTAGSTGTTNATDLSFDDANHSDVQGGYYCEFRNVGLNATNKGGFIVMGGNGRILYSSTATVIKSYDSTNTASGPAITLAADDTEYRFGVAFGSSLLRVNTNNSWGTAAAYDGAYGNATSALVILTDNGGVGSIDATMQIRNIKGYRASYLATQQLIDTDMS